MGTIYIDRSVNLALLQRRESELTSAVYIQHDQRIEKRTVCLSDYLIPLTQITKTKKISTELR